MALILVSSATGVFWCTDCGQNVNDIDHYCLKEDENDDESKAI